MKNIKNNPPIPKPVKTLKGNVQRKTGNAYMKPETIGIKLDNIKIKPEISKSYSPPPIPIVGIGASAGGLESFEEFFRNITFDSGIAFVLVSHLDPSHASMLTEILQRSTKMPVQEVQNNMATEPNHVYVIPPNWDMALFHGVLQLVTPGKIRGQRMPIDYFFRSLAEDQEERAIGIILSGTGTDGTLGLRSILGEGGTTFVQDPATARYDGMPASAVRNNLATYVLAVDKIPAKLLSCIKSRFKNTAGLLNVPADSTVYDTREILKIIRSSTTHDFSLYKQTTLGRRIERRMEANSIDSIDGYARYLRGNPEETQILFKELLINVTNFFRDPEAFDILKKDIIPQIFLNKPAGYCFRIWVPASSTGEEAYSIALCFREYMDEIKQDYKIQIYSTDISEESINTARTGLYPENIALDVSPDRLKKFFIKEAAAYKVKKEIREMVINDPPFIKLDFISCRNLLIYLEPQLQKLLISIFSYSLKPEGILFLGTAETIGSQADLFGVINKKYKFYKSIPFAAPKYTGLFGNFAFHEIQKKEKIENNGIKTDRINLAEITNRELLKSYAPSSVVIDVAGNILFVYGDTGNYLSPAPGPASLNIIEMAVKELKLKVSTAIRNAVTQQKQQEYNNIIVKTNGDTRAVNLIVRPLIGADKSPELLLVSFQEINSKLPEKAPAAVKLSAKIKEAQYIEELEKELAYEKENLIATIEESQASNEELKSTNEELQSTNEELQSTNEELDTSREEMQSVNEELVTVNSELSSKIDQLAEIQNDLKNLLENMNVGTIFLDAKLNIKRFTRMAIKLFNLIPSDIGRPLNDINSKVLISEIISKARYSLEMFTTHEEELLTEDGAWYLMRILPYRTTEEVVDGVVITFTDITTLKKIEASYRDASELAENIFNTVREPMLTLDKDLRINSASKSFYDCFKVTPEETIGNLIYDLGNKQWDIPKLKILLEEILPKHSKFDDYEVEHEFLNIGRKVMLLNARIIDQKVPCAQLILLAIEDITGRKQVKLKSD
jgi:two-component system CheB/CheR fusion protein